MLKNIRVNGREVECPADPRVSLLDLLRETLSLHGTKVKLMLPYAGTLPHRDA